MDLKTALAFILPPTLSSLALLFAYLFKSSAAQRQAAISTILHDISQTAHDWDALEPSALADRIAAILAALDTAMIANGWRPTGPGEQHLATIRLKAYAGAQRALKATPSIAKALLVLLALSMGVGTAHAQPVISTGPSIPLVQIRLADPATGKAVTSLLQAGAGYQLSFGFGQRELGGKQFDLLDLNLAFFGGLGQEAGFALDTASVAGLVCTLNSLLCAGVGVDLVQYYGGDGGRTSGVLLGNVGARNVMALLSLGFNFDIGPLAPPTGVEAGARGLPRGNTVFLW